MFSDRWIRHTSQAQNNEGGPKVNVSISSAIEIHRVKKQVQIRETDRGMTANLPFLQDLGLAYVPRMAFVFWSLCVLRIKYEVFSLDCFMRLTAVVAVGFVSKQTRENGRMEPRVSTFYSNGVPWINRK